MHSIWRLLEVTCSDNVLTPCISNNAFACISEIQKPCITEAVCWFDLQMMLFMKVYRVSWCCSHIKPMFFNSCWLVFQLAAMAINLRPAVVGWALWSQEPSAATLFASMNHLIVVVAIAVFTPFQTRICWYWWLEPPCQVFLHLAQYTIKQELTGKALHRRKILKSANTKHGQGGDKGPDPIWYKVNLHWVNGWDVWVVH